jgi:hypothetical protein
MLGRPLADLEIEEPVSDAVEGVNGDDCGKEQGVESVKGKNGDLPLTEYYTTRYLEDYDQYQGDAQPDVYRLIKQNGNTHLFLLLHERLAGLDHRKADGLALDN